MKYALFLLWPAAACLVILAAGEADAQDRQPEPVPPSGVVVLRNGEVFTGQVSQIGAVYVVAVPYGEMRFHASEVEYRCATLQEAHQRKLAAIAPDDLDERLRLAQWCVKQRLFAEAVQELDAVAARQPNHPSLRVLRQRLELMRQPPLPRKPAAAAALPRSNSAELDRLVRNLPVGAMETFAQRVQPLLVNQCATAGCHGPASTAKFQLIRVSNPQASSRRATQQNLLAALAMVDRQNPAASPLLTKPAQPHGSIPSPLLPDPMSPQYRNLVDWVQLATCRPEAPHDERTSNPVTAAASIAIHGQAPGHVQRAVAGDPLPSTITLEGQEPGPGGRHSAAHRPRATLRGARPASLPAPTTRTPSRRMETDGAPTPPSPPADPFDPEAFNRRFASPPPAANAGSSP